MITGLGTFTTIHRLLSNVALLSAMPVVFGLLRGSRSSRWFGAFWVTATATATATSVATRCRSLKCPQRSDFSSFAVNFIQERNGIR